MVDAFRRFEITMVDASTSHDGGSLNLCF